MLARVTYGLVGVAAITLILGFFVTKDSNVLLYVSIGLSLLAIVLIIVGAARRAREAPSEAGAFREAGEPTDEEEIPADILSAFEDEDLEDYEDEEEFEPAEDAAFDEEDEEDEEYEPDLDEEEDEEEPAPRRAAAATKTKTKKKTPQKKKASTSKKKAASKKKTAAKKSTGKVSVVPGRDRYHASDCRFVRDKDDVEELTKTSAKRRGYEPCSVCSPDD